MQKTWMIVFQCSRLTTLVTIFPAVILLPQRLATIPPGSKECWLALAIIAASCTTFYWVSIGSSKLGQDLGLYWAFIAQKPYRMVKLRFNWRLEAGILLVSGLTTLAVSTFRESGHWLISGFYDVIVFPMGIENLFFGVLAATLRVRMKLYLRPRRQMLCWYEYDLFWFDQHILVTTYGCCRVYDLESALAEIHLANYTAAVKYIRQQHPDFDLHTTYKAADKLLAGVLES